MLLFRGFDGALEYLLKFGENMFTLYPNARIEKIMYGWV